MSAYRNQFQNFQFKTVFEWLRFGLLLFGLLLPCATPAAVATVISAGTGIQIPCEDIVENITLSETHRLRNSRVGRRAGANAPQPSRTPLGISPANDQILSECQISGHTANGHRIRNGLLAPLQC